MLRRCIACALISLLIGIPAQCASDADTSLVRQTFDFKALSRPFVPFSVGQESIPTSYWQEQPKPPSDPQTAPAPTVGPKKAKRRRDRCDNMFLVSIGVLGGMVAGGIYLIATSNQTVQEGGVPKKERSGARLGGGIGAIVAGPIAALIIMMKTGCD
jgi:hypothetical protein